MDSAPGAVINWFDKDGKPAEMLYPKDHFSIRDTIEDIMKTQAGKKLMEAVLSNAMSQMAGSGLQFDDKMMKMVGGFTIERVTKMAGKRIDPAMIVELNRALNKIPKP